MYYKAAKWTTAPKEIISVLSFDTTAFLFYEFISIVKNYLFGVRCNELSLSVKCKLTRNYEI